jgi:hypothetical protein
MRLSAALAVIFAFGTSCIAQDVARSWYPLQPGNLLRGELPADYCFPLAKGTTWGRMPTTSPANEYVWYVVEDIAGPLVRRRVGLLHEVDEHHGTYDEDRQQLVK